MKFFTFRKSILESRKPSGLTRLFDELYKDMLKSAVNSQEALNSFVDQVMAYAEGGQPLGVGSSRMVILDGDEVIKVALNEAGFAQNGIEATLGNDPEVESVVVPVTSTSDVVDHEGFLWITSEKAAPLKMEGFTKEWQRIRELLKGAAKGVLPGTEAEMKSTGVEVPRPQQRGDRRDEDISVSEVFTLDMLKAFQSLIERYPEINTGDLYKPDSWGVHRGKLKLLDAGFTKSISRGYYMSSGSGGLLYAGSEKAGETSRSKKSTRETNISQKISANVSAARAALKQRQFPQETALLVFLSGLVEPLPQRVVNYDPDKGITKFDIKSAMVTVDDNYDKILGYIERIPDTSLRSELESGLDGVLSARGMSESILRRYIRMVL